MIGALILGLVAGFIGRALVPNDIFSEMSGPTSWAVSSAASSCCWSSAPSHAA